MVSSNADETGSGRESDSKVVSERRRAANRANARKSTGPRTVRGKKRSRHNATKHGLRGELPPELVPRYVWLEDAYARTQSFPRMRRAFKEDLCPRGAVETFLVERLAHTAWRLRRADHIEAELLDRAEVDALHESARQLPQFRRREFPLKEAMPFLRVGDDIEAIEQQFRLGNQSPHARLTAYQARLEGTFRSTLRELRMLRKASGDFEKEEGAEAPAEPETPRRRRSRVRRAKGVASESPLAADAPAEITLDMLRAPTDVQVQCENADANQSERLGADQAERAAEGGTTGAERRIPPRAEPIDNPESSGVPLRCASGLEEVSAAREIEPSPLPSPVSTQEREDVVRCAASDGGSVNAGSEERVVNDATTQASLPNEANENAAPGGSQPSAAGDVPAVAADNSPTGEVREISAPAVPPGISPLPNELPFQTYGNG